MAGIDEPKPIRSTPEGTIEELPDSPPSQPPPSPPREEVEDDPVITPEEVDSDYSGSHVYHGRPRRSGPHPAIVELGRAHSPETHTEKYEYDHEVKRGLTCQIKNLYQGPEKCECCVNWVEEPPAGIGLSELLTRVKWGGYAVVVRKTSHGADHA